MREINRLTLFLLLAAVLILTGALVQAQDNPNGHTMPDTVTIAGTVQVPAGCPGDWDTACESTMLTLNADTGVWEATFSLPAGSYEYKAAFNGKWDIAYGLGGDSTPGSANIPLVLDTDADVSFYYDHALGLVWDSINGQEGVGAEPVEAVPAVEGDVVIPDMVNIPGTIQPALGCPGEWAPDCEATALEYLPDYDVWMRTFENIPAGSYEYKVAINGSWTENYGGFADQDGPNISLSVPEDTPITFLYDHKIHWVSDSVRDVIVTAPGSYQAAIGCSGDWQPECLLSWLQDIDGDGIYTMSMTMPAGDYEAKAAINMTWDVNYGEGGVQDGPNIPFTVPDDTTPVNFLFDSALNVMIINVGGGGLSASNLSETRAHWVSADTLAWDVEADEDFTYKLLYSTNAEMEMSLFGLAGVEGDLTLSVNPDGLSDAIKAKFPQLADFTAFTIADDDLAEVPAILKGQFAIAAYNTTDELVNIAGLQIPGVLDDLYTYEGDLGIVWEGDAPTLKVWAPTARSVKLHLFEDSSPRTEATVLDMANDAETGVWSISGEADWAGLYYLYEVEVYAPSTMTVETNLVTDPYSVSLSVNSQRSQIVDLSSMDLMPEGWADYEKPALDAPEDIVVYELHIRDFSAFDESVPEDLRGTYLAFTLSDTNGVNHLQALADAGLTHLHLLPSFDIATINENKARWFEPDYSEFVDLPADSEVPQAELEPLRDLDGFNWGYDPYHYNTPEGSYATDPDGSARVLEFRQMVKALNDMGLRVVIDVVYNHTNASGQASKSVLDRIVPGYYHRLNAAGRVETSTCCQNTATEHNMMRKLMVDSVVLWATEYKVDGFRFDLMGHHMKDDMIAVRDALDSLTLANDGVDGQSIYVYGEGWNFGEVANNTRGVNATQANMAGTGIGTFNDRLRDAVRGGSPFGGRGEQGFITGIGVFSNGITPGDEAEQHVQALLFADQIRTGMAGNLLDYTFVGADGSEINGTMVPYNGEPSAYTADPQENIVYISKHDNETLFDIIAYKGLDWDATEIARAQAVGLSIVGYSQGVLFFQAGSDMLRSKSLDRNSYNSGDWFNRLDFTYQMNNFGVGLPPAGDNSGQWDVMRPLLTNEAYYPAQDDILYTVQAFQEILQVRQSSPLFHLPTAQDVQDRLVFHNTGPDQVPGVIVMSLSDRGDLEDIDPNNAMIVVVINARPDDLSITAEAVVGLDLQLHPVLADSFDPIVKEAAFDSASGTFSVPAHTTAVFVLPQGS